MFERAPVNHQSLPTATALERVRRQMALSADAQDVYLAYEGAPQLGLSGLLVSMRGDIDQIVAYCPLSKATPPCTPAWRDEVRRQLRVAARVAERPESARTAADVVWLGYVGAGNRAVPNWVYALACLPVTYPWDGRLLSPRPFCPALFERMAGQPQAARWLRRQEASPQATAGVSERAPAAPFFAS